MPPAVNGRKTCNTCRVEQSVEEFSKDKSRSGGFKNNCRACAKEYSAKRTADGRGAAYQRKAKDATPGRQHYYNARDRAKKHDIPFDLTYEWVRARVVDARCQYCGCDLVIRKSAAGGTPRSKADSPSLDRIVPSRGYTTENVVVCCNACNMAKGDSSLSEFEARVIAQYNNRHTWPKEAS